MSNFLKHFDDADRNKSPQNYGKTVYNNAIGLIQKAREISETPTLVLSQYARDLILIYLKDSGIDAGSLEKLGGVPVEVVENHIEQNHALASIGVRV